MKPFTRYSHAHSFLHAPVTVLFYIPVALPGTTVTLLPPLPGCDTEIFVGGGTSKFVSS